jgi:beta-galactosidase
MIRTNSIKQAPTLVVCLGMMFNASFVSGGTYSNFNNGAITNHVPWLDTGGNLINAHDGGIIYAGGKYHWYGMALRPLPVASGTNGGQKTIVGVVMYSSPDLYNWTDEGVILACSTNPASPLYGPMRFERPKIIYNSTTKKYVMWFHYVGYPGNHGNRIGLGDAGVASGDTVNGKYTFQGYHRPIDTNSIVRDCTLYQDDDGTAYFIYDRDVRVPGPDFGRVLHVVKLTGDYLAATSTFYKITNAPAREAPVMIKRNGAYFIITSGESGWKFNRANYYRATNILGPYTEAGDPCVGPDAGTTFNSQGTQAFAVQGKKDAFIFISERHNTACMTDSSFIFLPINFPSPSTLELQYLAGWDLNHWPSASTAGR